MGYVQQREGDGDGPQSHVDTIGGRQDNEADTGANSDAQHKGGRQQQGRGELCQRYSEPACLNI